MEPGLCYSVPITQAEDAVLVIFSFGLYLPGPGSTLEPFLIVKSTLCEVPMPYMGDVFLSP